MGPHDGGNTHQRTYRFVRYSCTRGTIHGGKAAFIIFIQYLPVQLRGRDILEDIGFVVPKGRIVMLLGENDNGKATSIRSLLQYIPYRGCILHEKNDIHSLKQRRFAVLFSYVPQIKETVENLTVEGCIISDFVRTPSPFALSLKKRYEQVHTLLKDWNPFHIEGKLLQEIGGGELQVTYVARIFLQDAALIVMGEPCAYLDYRCQHQFPQEMLRLRLQERSMLTSMRDPNLALQYADEFVLLHQGKPCAHICGPRPEITAARCAYYNKLYGDTFIVIGTKSEPAPIWRGNNCAGDSAAPQGREP